MKNDLHVRTNFSASASNDCNYENVLQKLQQAGIERASITDFDTCIFHLVSKIYDISRIYTGTMIPGMECDVFYDGLVFELLAYDFDVFKTFEWSYDTYGTLDMRQTKIKDLLIDKVEQAGLKFDYSAQFNGKSEFGHKFVYENLSKFEQNKELFDKYNITKLSDFYSLSTSNKDFPLYVDLGKVFPSIDKVVDFIHSAGGFVVLAHPFRHKGKIEIAQLLNIADEYNVDGVEVYHPVHSPEDIDYLLNYCQSHHKIITGGSNYNGTEQYNNVGIQNIDDDQIHILENLTVH